MLTTTHQKLLHGSTCLLSRRLLSHSTQLQPQQHLEAQYPLGRPFVFQSERTRERTRKQKRTTLQQLHRSSRFSISPVVAGVAAAAARTEVCICHTPLSCPWTAAPSEGAAAGAEAAVTAAEAAAVTLGRSMGAVAQPLELRAMVQQPEEVHSGPSAEAAAPGHLGSKTAPAAGAAVGSRGQSQAAAGSAAAAAAVGGDTGQCPVQYWYQRAHRALKQRASEPLQLMREYQHVCALDYSITHAVSVAKSKAAVGRNRYGNVLPYDYNRVVLQQHKTPYVNASTVQYSTPSLPHPCSYIATQGPLPATTADFWGMVLELRVPAVVMLTKCAEAGMVKCSQYFPDTPGCVSRAGSCTIQVQQQEPFGQDCTLRTLQLSCSSSGATHTLSHYHFHAWPDHGTPESSSGIRAMCRALAPSKASGRSVVVHCSAGIGRTGTFCAIDILLQRLDSWATMRGGCGPERSEVEDTLDVPALVHKLRAQRMGMVQTIEQYVFVYKALIDDLASRIKGSRASSSSGSVLSSGSNALAAATAPPPAAPAVGSSSR